jgi:hypothetical protein
LNKSDDFAVCEALICSCREFQLLFIYKANQSISWLCTQESLHIGDILLQDER